MLVSLWKGRLESFRACGSDWLQVVRSLFLVSDPSFLQPQTDWQKYIHTWTACRRAVLRALLSVRRAKMPCLTLRFAADWSGGRLARGIEDWRVTLAMMDNAIIKPRYHAYSSCELSSTPPLDLSCYKGNGKLLPAKHGISVKVPPNTGCPYEYRGPSFRRVFCRSYAICLYSLTCCFPVVRSGSLVR